MVTLFFLFFMNGCKTTKLEQEEKEILSWGLNIRVEWEFTIQTPHALEFVYAGHSKTHQLICLAAAGSLQGAVKWT